MGLGTQLNGVSNGMVLNFDFNNWGTSCQSSREFCISTIAIHEFGHALAFAHEQNRPDTPNWCDQEQGSDGDVTIGDWDLDSVMNYCNPNWNGNGELSDTDMAAARQLYGNFSQVHYWPMSAGVRQGGYNIYNPVGGAWTLRDVGDVDGNGTDDIVWQHENGQVHYWPMSGGVRQGGYDIHNPVGTAWFLKAVGDVNGDGTDDIVWQGM